MAELAIYRGERARWAILLLLDVMDFGANPPELVAEGQWRFKSAPTPWDQAMRLPSHHISSDEQVIDLAELEAAHSAYGSLDAFIAAGRANAIEELRHG